MSSQITSLKIILPYQKLSDAKPGWIDFISTTEILTLPPYFRYTDSTTISGFLTPLTIVTARLISKPLYTLVYSVSNRECSFAIPLIIFLEETSYEKIFKCCLQ